VAAEVTDGAKLPCKKRIKSYFRGFEAARKLSQGAVSAWDLAFGAFAAAVARSLRPRNCLRLMNSRDDYGCQEVI